MIQGLPPQNTVKKLQRRPKTQQAQQENSSAPEANLSRDASNISQQLSDSATQNASSQGSNSYNESYLQSQRGSADTQTSSPLSVLNYDNYPSIQLRSDGSSAVSNIDVQMHDLEEVYSKITSALQTSGVSQDVDKSAAKPRPSLQNSPNENDGAQQFRISNALQSSPQYSNLSVPAEPPKASSKPLLQMFDNTTNQFTQIVTHDSVVPVARQQRGPANPEYKNLESGPQNQRGHSDDSYMQQEVLIKNLQAECDRLQKAQPKPPKDQLEMNYQFQLSQRTREVAELKARMDGMAGEFRGLAKENEQMRAVLQRLIAELHGEDVEISLKQLGEELSQLIKQAQGAGQALSKDQFYQQRIQEAVVDLEAMKRLLEEKQRELDQARAEAPGPGVQMELRKRDKLIQEQLAQIQKLQTEAFEAKTAQRQDSSQQAQIDQLNQLLQLAQLRQKQMEQQQFENQKNYERFADERIEVLRSGYQDQVQQLQLKVQRAEQDNMRFLAENESLKQENERLKISQKDDRIQAIEEKISQQPLSNQLMERAVLAEKKLRDEREHYEKMLLNNQRKLEDYENELGAIIGELEGLL